MDVLVRCLERQRWSIINSVCIQLVVGSNCQPQKAMQRTSMPSARACLYLAVGRLRTIPGLLRPG